MRHEKFNCYNSIRTKKDRMKVTEKDVAYVADLANLELTPQESLRMVADLNSILDHIDKLNQLDTRNVEPMSQVLSAPASAGESGDPFAYAQRSDEVTPGLSRKVALSNAPDTDGTCFKVPKVIER
jgi:aspartyl-tRNA(Asn)/glutamyl-tRNA(Gln) amidotransferase subunit C